MTSGRDVSRRFLIGRRRPVATRGSISPTSPGISPIGTPPNSPSDLSPPTTPLPAAGSRTSTFGGPSMMCGIWSSAAGSGPAKSAASPSRRLVRGNGFAWEPRPRSASRTSSVYTCITRILSADRPQHSVGHPKGLLRG